jgi:hypothetical protein
MTSVASSLWAILESTPPPGSDMADLRDTVRQLIAIRSASPRGALLLGCTLEELQRLARAISDEPA